MTITHDALDITRQGFRPTPPRTGTPWHTPLVASGDHDWGPIRTCSLGGFRSTYGGRLGNVIELAKVNCMYRYI